MKWNRLALLAVLGALVARPALAWNVGASGTNITVADGKVSVSGTIAVTNGGSGVASWSANNSVLLTGTSSTGAVQVVAGGTAGNVLVSGGAGVAPTFTTINLASSAAVGSSILPFANGGTGLSTAADDTVMVSSGSAWVAKVLTDCTGAGKAVTYTASANTWGCNTITAGVAPQAFFGTGSDFTSGATVYMGLNGSLDPGEAAVQIPVQAATYGNMRCYNPAIQGSGKDIVITARVGACGSLADGTLTCTLTGAGTGNVSCTGAGSPATVAPTAGQCVAFKAVAPSGMTASANISCSIERTA